MTEFASAFRDSRIILRASGLIFVFFGAFQVISIMEIYEKDIHWTPIGDKLSYSQSASRFEVFIGGRELKDLMAKKGLFVPVPGGFRSVSEADVEIRLNSADKKVQIHQTLAAIFLTLGLVSLILGLMPWPEPKNR